MMADLDDSMREDLAQLRALSGPSERALQRMWVGIEARLGPGPGEPGTSEGPGGDPSGGTIGAGAIGSGGSGLAQAGFAAKVVAATVALTGAGLLTLRAAAVVVRLLVPADEREAMPDEHSARSGASTASLSTEAVHDTAPDTTQTTPIELAKPTRSKPAVRSTPTEPALVDRSLSAELALLKVAHDAVAPEATLAALDEHLRTFPEGQLADERELMRFETLCKLARLDAARAVGEQLLRRNRSVAARIHELCPALDLR